MTGIGKLLVFVNLFVAVALLSWAASLNVNRLDWVDGKDAEGKTVKGEITRLKEEIDRTAKAVAEADVGYGQARTEMERQEAGRAYRKDKFDDRLARARQGTGFTVQLLLGDNPNAQVAPDLKARIDVDREGPEVKAFSGEALRGVDAIQKQLSDEVRQSADLTKQIDAHRKKFEELSGEIADTDRKIDVQKVILTNLADEAKFLGSSQVNRDEELRTLERRLRQLEKRLGADAK